ncbi:uncharacterized protein LOC129589511 [Paramacrobiotus metropolitanus]|uniref:uncharacterized protein LOC129589511 n=1 Tax=Paramacrobiotus metropolitanus TaxID=2943436 RepID=UPI002445EABF|nr:uncharacterized protein LOC129589511 [Paramacrobiotus metropolitanus]
MAPDPRDPSPLIAAGFIQFGCALSMMILSGLSLYWFGFDLVFLLALILGIYTVVTAVFTIAAGFFVHRNWSKVICCRFVKRSVFSTGSCSIFAGLLSAYIFLILCDTQPTEIPRTPAEQAIYSESIALLSTLVVIVQLLIVTNIALVIAAVRTYWVLSTVITQTLASYLARMVPPGKEGEALGAEANFVADFIWTNV